MVSVVSGEGQLKILQGSRGDILINYKRKKYVFGIGMRQLKDLQESKGDIPLI
jgi:hypothetical protein